MNYLLLLASILMCVCKSSLYNIYAKREKPCIGKIYLFNGFAYGIAALITLISGIGTTLSTPTLITALAYALCVFSLQALSILAMSKGPMALTSLIVTYGMLIPALAGPIAWQEEFGITQIIGVAIMLVSLWLLQNSAADGRKLSRVWILLAASCFLLSGLAGLLEKIHQSTDAREERSMFIFTSCTVMFILSLIGTLTTGKKTPSGTRLTMLLGGATGVIVSLYSLVNLTLAGKLDSLIYYPIANGGAVPLTVLVSVLCFKEKLSVRRLLGFGVGLVSIVLLSIAA